jgi:hypothetical protein
MYKNLVAGLVLSVGLTATAWGQTVIPNDAKPTCAVSPWELSTWFGGRTITKNGWVNPANGITFPPASINTACDFYKWGQQMFLWLTTPIGSAHVFDGPQFFDVVHAGSNFVMQANVPGLRNNQFKLRAVKTVMAAQPGDPVDSTAQAGGSGVLLTQNGSLVYYGINVNDVFAYYTTGAKQTTNAFAGTSIATDFPTTQPDIDLVQSFARTFTGNPNFTFPDGIALSMEIKTSWVDANTVQDRSKHLVINAVVPAYNRTNPALWINIGSENKDLALVGMHVVGTVAGHPEMVWATFEHVDNAPDKAYSYTNNRGSTTQVPFNSAGSWTFTTSGAADTNVIDEYQKVVTETIAGQPVSTITAQNVNNVTKIRPVDLVRVNPWGDLPDGVRGGGTTALIANATDLISLNSTVNTQLQAVGDLRGNYFQSGSIWSANGEIPTSGTEAFLRGSLNTANATMETYHQFSSASGGSTTPNCFGCHFVTGGTPGNGTSHIFGHMKALQ